MLSSLMHNDELAAEVAKISLDKKGATERYPDEPLLKKNNKRFVLFPIVWNDVSLACCARWQAEKTHPPFGRLRNQRGFCWSSRDLGPLESFLCTVY